MLCRAILGVSLGLLIPASLADAGIILDLGNGWEATLFSDNIDLVVDNENDPDLVVLQKFAIFDVIDGFTGSPASVSIGFRQTLPDELTASRIVITEEFLTNKTGMNWTGFRMILLGPHVSFKSSALDDLVINPFAEFELLNEGTEVFFFGGGVVENDSFWNPRGPGGIAIDIDLYSDLPDDRINFVLKELPVVPGPYSLALISGAMLVTRRRRRV